MKVIFHPVYLIKYTFPVFDDPPNITVKFFLMLCRNRILTVVSTENNVVKDLPVAVHVTIILGNPNGLRGL